MEKATDRDINSIKVNVEDRVLKLDRVVVNRVKKSVQTIGRFINPVIIDKYGNLLCGYIRVVVGKELGHTTIPTIVVDISDPLMKKYFEISENLDRRHFTYLQHGQMLIEGKEVYEKLNPQSKNTHNKETDGFTKNTSENSDKSQRVLQNNLKIYSDLMNIENKFILPLLHTLEDRLGFRHSKEELKSIPLMEDSKLLKFVSILRDIDKKGIKRTKDMRLKKILLNLDSFVQKQTVNEDETLSFQIYKFCSNKPKYKELLDTIEIDLVKYKKTDIKINNDFKKLVKFLESGTK
ncbi:MAG: ParB/RepB/Spo0J family partition protein [Campylobacterota bacterium]|nr:ParB/RepB/Spo0J family partition protein [Campylobacterota bacterium]